jgi:Uma2 family endonuclease
MGEALIPQEMLAGEYLFQRYGATVEDYERAADEDTRLELCEGMMIMHSPANVRHENIFWFLGALLRGFAARHRLGLVLGSRTPMYLDDERRFEPDLIFISNDRLDKLGETVLSGPADLVVEILSPATREYDLGKKRDAYAEGGVPEYWIIDPMDSVVMVERPAGNRVSDLKDGRLETPALPGFRLDVAWLWRDPPPDAAESLRRILHEE